MKGLVFDALESDQWEQFKSQKPKNVRFGMNCRELIVPV